MEKTNLPRFVVLEGVDGSGKTTLITALSKYYRQIFSNVPLYADAFPGSHPGTLGEWVYRFHHNRVSHAPSTAKVAPPALQLLHVAAHVDTILTSITPTLAAGGNVLLDRYWWSTYAYSRPLLTPEQVETLIAAERMFWEPLIRPIIIYVTRKQSLKDYQLTPENHKRLDGYYREIMDRQRQEGVVVYELANDGPLVETWQQLLQLLNLPPVDMDP